MPSLVEGLLPLVCRVADDPAAEHSLRRLGDAAGCSPAHLQRRFQALVGESPKQFAVRLGLQRAAARLLREETAVLEIALDSGFESHEGFTRAFHKRFGVSPRAYRARFGGSRARHLGETLPCAVATLGRHAALVDTVAPCVGLYRLSKHRSKEGGAMSYDIVSKKIEETPILFQRDRIGRDQIAATLSRILPAVFAYASENGFALAGRPFLRCETSGPGLLAIQAGLPVGEGARAGDDVELGTLPGGPVAFTLHLGPYESLPAAYAAVERWMEEHGLEGGSAPWESYVTDPGEVADPAEWQTEIYWPLAR